MDQNNVENNPSEGKKIDKIFAEKTETDELECPVCLQTCVQPMVLPCGHVFCFLCVKGSLEYVNSCSICRFELPADVLKNPKLLEPEEVNQQTSEDGYQWFYEGRNGWWQYDQRTAKLIEEAYQNDEMDEIEISIGGGIYVIDLLRMVQFRKTHGRIRRIKRDLCTVPKIGVAGIKLKTNVDENLDNLVTDALVSLNINDGNENLNENGNENHENNND